MSSEELSHPLDLLYVRHQGSEDEVDGEKHYEHSEKSFPDFETIIHQLNQKYSELRDEVTFVVDKKQVSSGVWDAQLEMVRVVEERNLKQYPCDGNKCLHPYQALFLLECRMLSVSYCGLCLSVQDAYQLFLSTENDFCRYRIFSILSRAGYYIHFFKDIPLKFSLERPQCEVNHSINLKRSNEETCGEFMNKKLNMTLNKSNHKVVTSTRFLELRHFRKMTKTDKTLVTYCKPTKEDERRSVLYFVRDSVTPVTMNRLVSPLHSGTTQPVLPLGSLLQTEQLFRLIQDAGPRESTYCQTTSGGEEFYCDIDFVAFGSKQQMKSGQGPLFGVKVVSENDPVPSMDHIDQLSRTCSFSLFFALVTKSLEFNFYGLERLSIGTEYPRLWEKYYASRQK